LLNFSGFVGLRSARARLSATMLETCGGSMRNDVGLPVDRDDAGLVHRALRSLDDGRIAVAGLACLVLSLESLSSPDLFDFFSAGEIALAWLERLAELAVMALTLTLAYTLVEQALSRTTRRVRLAASCGALVALSAALSLLLYGYYAHGFEHLPPPGRLLSDSLRVAVPAIFLVLIADVHRRAVQVDSAAHEAEILRVQLRHDEAQQQLALLQAQIEPHFLFNVLGNVRRLYRTQPAAGAEAISSLMRYLRAALPRIRTQSSSVGGELELVRAYLDLLKVRMSARLTFVIDAAPGVEQLEFPPMLLLTLVENAVKHGLEPVGGGSVRVTAARAGDTLHVSVVDDGAGLGGSASDGTGVGLGNVRRQLATRYRDRGRLVIQSHAPKATRAAIAIPARSAAIGASSERRA